MNTQLNNSIGSSGGSKYLIASGQTEEGYAAMLSQALALTKQKAEQAKKSIYAARERSKAQEWLWNEGCKISTERVKAIKIEEVSPGTAYQCHLEAIEQVETVELSPVPVQQTGTIDISLEATRLEGEIPYTWNPYDLLAEKMAQQTDGIDRSHMADLATIHGRPNEIQCTPLPEQVSPVLRPRITIQLEDEEPRLLHFVTGLMGAREMVETAISEYIRQYDVLPALIRVSPSTLLRMDPRIYWTVEETTFYQSLCHGLFIVEISIALDHMTVECQEAE